MDSEIEQPNVLVTKLNTLNTELSAELYNEKNKYATLLCLLTSKLLMRHPEVADVLHECLNHPPLESGQLIGMSLAFALEELNNKQQA